MPIRIKGKAIREFREAAGMSLAALANQAGISEPYLSRIERDVRQPSGEVIKAITRALGIRLSDIADGITPRLDAVHDNDFSGVAA